MQHGERQHALLSASGAYRWLNCTPSARLEDKVEDQSSIYAREGTLAHEFADAYLTWYNKDLTTRSYNALVKELKKHELYSAEMDDEVKKYTDIVVEEFKQAKKKTKDAILAVEEKLDLTDFVPDSFGTGDALIVADGRLKVIDLKYGKGLKVDATNNPQLKLYGLGALSLMELFYDIQEVEMVIIQPRLDHYSSFTVSTEDLKHWAATELKEKAKLAFDGEGELTPGPHCQFCKVAPRCRALADENLRIANDTFLSPELLSDEELVEIHEKTKQITNWLGTVNDYILSEALNGKQFPGLKLVEGRSLRQWDDDEKVIEVLKGLGYSEAEILKVQLQGITAITKLLGKKKFDQALSDLIIKPEGKPTLAKIDDPRPEWIKAEKAFS
jgi:hypothetical protein